MTRQIEIIGEITSIEEIASGPSLRLRRYLSRAYGPGRWRKLKGLATVRLPDGFVGKAEIHWYEAHGKGRVDLKIKRMLSR